jgi:FeS assembly SUF system protein
MMAETTMTDDDRLDQATEFLADAPADKTAAPDVDVLGERVIDALRSVYDPEIPVNIFELGLIYKVDIDDDSKVNIEMTLTSPACPVAGTLPDEVKERVEAVDGIVGANVEVVWDPPWHPGMMTEEAQLELGMMY